MGFILYPGSKRYVGDDYNLTQRVPKRLTKVGVTVDETIEKVLDWIVRLRLDYIQLHGKESAEYCRELHTMGFGVIKAFGIDENFDFQILDEYQNWIDYFLFDTKTKLHGGSGQKFNWEILSNYKLQKPFFLSGGIGPDDFQLNDIPDDLPLHAIDINSRFETKPGFKDINLLEKFMTNFRTFNTSESEI